MTIDNHLHLKQTRKDGDTDNLKMHGVKLYNLHQGKKNSMTRLESLFIISKVNYEKFRGDPSVLAPFSSTFLPGYLLVTLVS